MTKFPAPSEKHLEDYLWRHPEALGRAPTFLGDNLLVNRYDFTLRQFRIPSGVIDLIAFFRGWEMTIFELKRDVLTAQSLTQLMRYMSDIQRIVTGVFADLSQQSQEWKGWLRQFETAYGYDLRETVRGALLGSGIENDNLLIACAACHVDVFHYRYEGGQYTFARYATPEYPAGYRHFKGGLGRISNGPLGTAIMNNFHENVMSSLQKKPWNAADAATAYLNDIDLSEDNS